MSEMRRDRLTNDEPLGLREQAFCRHGCSNPPTGLADGLEVGILYSPSPSGLRRNRPVAHPSVSGEIRPGSSNMLEWVPRIASLTRRLWHCSDYERRIRGGGGQRRRTYGLFT